MSILNIAGLKSRCHRRLQGRSCLASSSFWWPPACRPCHQQPHCSLPGWCYPPLRSVLSLSSPCLCVKSPRLPVEARTCRGTNQNNPHPLPSCSIASTKTPLPAPHKVTHRGARDLDTDTFCASVFNLFWGLHSKPRFFCPKL